MDLTDLHLKYGFNIALRYLRIAAWSDHFVAWRKHPPGEDEVNGLTHNIVEWLVGLALLTMVESSGVMVFLVTVHLYNTSFLTILYHSFYATDCSTIMYLLFCAVDLFSLKFTTLSAYMRSNLLEMPLNVLCQWGSSPSCRAFGPSWPRSSVPSSHWAHSQRPYLSSPGMDHRRLLDDSLRTSIVPLVLIN